MAILLSAILLGKVVSFIHSLGEPMSKDILDVKQYTWNTKSSINIAVKSSGVSVLNYDPVNKKIVILRIPNDTYFELPKGFGSWPVGSIYELGQEENPPVGSELLKESLAKLLGLPIDGFMTFKDPHTPKLDELISSWHTNPLRMIASLRNIDTDLTPLEALSLMHALSQVRSDQITWLDISQSDLTDSKLLPDSTRVLGVDSVQLDLFVRNNMADTTISQEGIPVGIFNATDHAGLGENANREITNMGGDVIFVTNTDTMLQKSIVTSTNTSTLSYKRLAQIFAPDCLKKKCQTSDDRVKNSRAQINVVLGEDFYQHFYASPNH